MTSPNRTSRSTAAALLMGLIGSFGLTAAACSEQVIQTPKTQEARMRTVLIPIEGMSCMACAAKVTQTLESIKGVLKAEVNLAERNARVQFAPTQVPLSQIVAAINGLGYKAGAPAEAK